MATTIVMASDWKQHLAKPMAEFLGKIAGQVEDDAASAVPVDTGALKSSIYSEVQGNTARIGVTEDYGREVELGTSKMQAQPFLGPALYRKRG